MSPQKKPARKPAPKGKGLTAEEKAAMREHLQDMKSGTDGEGVLLAKLAAMKGLDRTLGEKVHAIVMANGPTLYPKTWYGMPAYAKGGKNGKILCFFQSAGKFKARYATLGFTDQANLDAGAMWPTSFALGELTAADEAKIAALVKKAVGG